ncbi:putative mitochondrial acyl transferase-like protein [Leptomonas pyrrhocoris]|uniref:[acyl-carrier-protein] S-malonyltransferase n=1 Tax=Leptomonas pyrrhocoris TaxID=157538 RepID=A0A0N0VHQ9_LEPPY|nr:putative mitochondrial acyl transferase-like protein [Leptomonas pyrrhocoris]XP_015664841.1 putative mitochondrial acyl transferase-like protein [Leptomonas pyrrhocoris]KPA86401.1 putative mitochondrial acyl transferase-like protein [Leptomonas pyrrhocoris]KPA86402.1 putative mitochondrial acyl transferase-like protein [Leptomonas pyrrhocoris]|eukprot:XP_015664840.1 putative mitochondrial acyl transferase-like protein [Leptomonas pyrrhocoris]
MKNALIFSGQGTHCKGMCMPLLSSSAAAEVWDRMKQRMMCNYGISLQDIIQENPKKVLTRADAFHVEEVCGRPCTELLNAKESTPRTHAITHAEGVLQYTFFTQPCVLAAQLVAFTKLQQDFPQIINQQINCVAGHSLGEFTALGALGVFSPETAVDLTFKRGLLMEEACKGVRRGDWKLYACNPQRAQLEKDSETADKIFFNLVELVAKALAHTSSFVEVCNLNLRHQQYVVAGDLVGLAVLGKCLDPQFRANCEGAEDFESIVGQALIAVKTDEKDGVAKDPNIINDTDFATAAMKKYGARATFRKFLKGADDGYTPSLEELTHLTLQEDGRSGLKRKTWFIPLTVEVPFHSSRLRQAMDQFLPVVRSALPDEAILRDLFSISAKGTLNRDDHKFPLWVTNLTGRTFDPFNSFFQEEALKAIQQFNVGEIRHNGRYESSLVADTFKDGVDQGSVREITAALLAGQLAHPVQWITAMDELVLKNDCVRIQEVSPQKNLSEMVKRASFRIDVNSRPLVVMTASYPKEVPLFSTR